MKVNMPPSAMALRCWLLLATLGSVGGVRCLLGSTRDPVTHKCSFCTHDSDCMNNGKCVDNIFALGPWGKVGRLEYALSAHANRRCM
jgi:hypothetical protein